MRTSVLFSAAFLVASLGFAQQTDWKLTPIEDEMFDTVNYMAHSVTQEFGLAFHRREKLIFGELLALDPGISIEPSTRLLARVDKGEVWSPIGDPALVAQGAPEGGKTHPGRVMFPLWVGEGEYRIESDTSHLREILEGQSILFRVDTIVGTQDVRFALGPGARDVILAAINPGSTDLDAAGAAGSVGVGGVVDGMIRVDPNAHYLESTGPRVQVDTNPLHLAMDLSRLKTLEVFPTPKNNYEEQLWVERTGGVKPAWRTRATGRYALGGNLVIDSVEVIKVYPRRRKSGKAFVDIDMRARLVRVGDLVGAWMWYSAEILADGVPIASTTWPPKMTPKAPAVRLEYRWETTEEQLETWMQAGVLELRVKAWPQE